eukprot:TRINITY_DN3873_c0_g1_i1.p1 TRINITY_DN3873_c0_g1~~TRINITY_DN3873_c0_g1_i1.p1  ORF type:complete len:161 (+),score=22.34 TRINITY_DN3873_c0_g1_i1:126-608(+)
MVSLYIHSPLVIKTRMQFQRKSSGMSYYRNLAIGLKETVSKQGLGALYRGLPLKWIYIMPSAAINFTIYEQFKVFASGETEQSRWRLPLSIALGVGSRAFMTFYRNPFDIIIQQIQVGGISKFDTMNVRRSIGTVMDGAKIKGFYKGYWVTIVRDFGFGF